MSYDNHRHEDYTRDESWRDECKKVGEVERIKDPPHFDKLFLALMVKRMESKRDTGNLAENYPAKTHALDTVLSRLDSYVRSGNTAHLVDAANFLWIEFMYPSHDASYFRPLTEPQERVPVRENRIRCFACIVSGRLHCPHEKG
jgi:hypothetical protein